MNNIKYLSKRFLLILLIVGYSLPLYAYCVDGVYYNCNQSAQTATVTGYNKYSGVVNIPSKVEYEGVVYTVISIGDFAFYGCSSLTSITIPESVTTIGMSAFEDCQALKKLIFEDGENSLILSSKYNGLNVFHGLHVDSLYLGRNLQWEKGYLMFGANTLIIGKYISSLPKKMFVYQELTTHIISHCTTPPELNNAFSYVESVEVPKGLSCAYAKDNNWRQFKCIYVYEDGIKLYPIPVITSHINNPIYSLNGNNKELEVREGTKISLSLYDNSLDPIAFHHNIEITDSLLEGKVYSFYSSSIHSDNLISIYGPITVNNEDPGNLSSLLNEHDDIRYLKIAGCIDNTDIKVLKELGNLCVLDMTETVISDDAVFRLNNHHAIKKVILPNNLTTIPDNAFYNCTEMTSVNIPNSVTRIGYLAFRGCKSLKSVHIPSNVLSIETMAFYNCISLKSVYFQSSEETISMDLVSASYIEYGRTGTTIRIGVERYLKDIFFNCPIESIFLGRNIKYNIQDYDKGLFQGFSTLKHLEFSENVSIIPDSIFAYTKIKQIEIPKNILQIGVGAFYNCDSLSTVSFNYEYNNGLKRIEKSAFDGCVSLTEISLPPSLESNACSFLNCKFKKFVIADGNEILGMATRYVRTGSGKYVDTWKQLPLLLCKIDTLILGRDISAGVTPFNHSFNKVVITKSFNTFQNYLFQVSSIDSLYIEDGDVEITGNPSFDKVNYVYLGRKVEEGCFSNKLTIISLIIGDSVKEISPSCFKDCKNIKYLIFGKSLKSIGFLAFYNVGSSFMNYAECKSVVPPNFEGSYGDKNIFDKLHTKSVTLHVPQESIYLYKKSVWAKYFKIDDMQEDITEEKAEAIAKYNEGLSLYNSFVELNSKVRSAYDQLTNQQKYNLKLGDEIEREISELKGDIEAFDFDAGLKAYFLNVLDSVDNESYAYAKCTYEYGYDYLISELDNVQNTFDNYIKRLEEYKRSIESATTNSELEAITEQIGIDNSNIEAICQSSWEIDYNSMLQFIDVCKGYEAELLKLLQRLKDLKTELANTTSGIDTIVSTDADMVAYTLIGKRLPIKVNQIKSLPKGIYIINGKKILIQ